MIRAITLFLLTLIGPHAALAGPTQQRDNAMPSVVALQRGWGWTMCSGVVIGPDLVLTAAGCLFDTGALLPRADITVVPGLHVSRRPDAPDPKPVSRFHVRAVHIPAELHRRIDRFGYAPTPTQLRYVAPLDLAVLEILAPEGRPAFEQVTEALAVRSIDWVMAETPDAERELALGFAGYATEQQADTQYESRCTGASFDGRMIVSDCLSDTSMAGGPLFRLSDGAVLGVNHGSKLGEEDVRVAGSFAPVRDYMAPAINGLIARQPIPADIFFSYDLTPVPFMGVDVWNRCDRPVGVALRYLDDSDAWTTAGFFDVPAWGFASLPLRTTNSVIYWSAYRHGDSYFHWRSNDAQFDFKGAELDLIRHQAPEHWHDMRLQLECAAPKAPATGGGASKP